MSFTRLIVRNLFRQRARTLLTVLGISLGIMTVVALGVITAGFRQWRGDCARCWCRLHRRQKGSADLTFSTVPESELAQLQGQDGVENATGLLIVIRRVESNPFFRIVASTRQPAEH